MRVGLALLSILLLVLSGCASKGPSDDNAAGTTDQPGGSIPALTGFKPLPLADLPIFGIPVLIDTVRAGGEPVIAVTHSGAILVSAHPGFTHYHPSPDPTHTGSEILTPVNAQSYLWRSTDGGASWLHVGLPVAENENGPRSAGLGVSDPEFTVMEDGTICFTDLEALAAASTSCSTDDGVTWGTGNPLASGRPVDRQWLASYKDEFYFTANYLAGGSDFRVSTDRGMTWTERASTPCNSDLIANPANGHLYQGCNGNGIGLSTDGGASWQRIEAPENFSQGARIMAEPGLDSGGNLWIVGAIGERELHLMGSPDEGATWPWVYDLTPHFRQFTQRQNAADPGWAISNGSYVWPWISAGSDGRVAVTWIGSYAEEPSETFEGSWYIFTAYVLNATTSTPTVVVSQMTPEAIHLGPICQGGTGCQVTSVSEPATGDTTGDRRLGDFFETTIEPATGYLMGAWSNTHQAPNDVISHPQFARQVGGISLIAPEELGVFRPTQG